MTKEELCIKEFGKLPSEMTKEELIFAITAIANRLYQKTGDRRYKDTEDAFLCVMENLENGASDEGAVNSAVDMLKERGYSE